MKVNKTLTALIASAGLGLSSHAFAAGTDAGTTITNTATLDYKVNTIDQTQVSGAVGFKVAQLVSMTLQKSQTAATGIIPGATEALTFTVTNTGNDHFDYEFDLTESTGGTFYSSLTDNIDVASYAFYEDTNSDGTFDVGDQVITYLDEIEKDSSVVFFAVFTAPNQAAYQDVAGFDLELTAKQGNGGTTGALGGDITATPAGTPFDKDVVQVVIQSGSQTVQDALIIDSAKLEVTKTVDVLSDPVNGNTNPKAIPGATVEYTISIENTGTQSATTVVFSDDLNIDADLDSTVDFDFSTITNLNIDVTGLTTQTMTPANAATVQTNAQGSGSIDVTFTEIAPGDTLEVKFEVDLVQ